MDWERYKALCDAPDVCSRWFLEQTLELVDDAALAGRLRDVLTATPLAKPADHRGGPATDMFAMTLDLTEVGALRAAVARAVADGRTTRATAGRGLGGFAEAWAEYQRHLERRISRGPAACSTRS